MTRIDVHAHYSPPEYLRQMARLGAADELSIFRILPPVVSDRPLAEALADRIADMDAAAVDLQIVGLGAMQPYFAARAKAVEGARIANDELALLVGQEPERFSAFGTLPLPHVDDAVTELSRCIDELGFAGVGVGCSAAGIPIDNPSFDPLWAELDARRAVVFIHPGVAIDGVVGCTDHHLAPDFVSPAEMGVCVSRLVVSRITARFPGVSIVLATTGGSLPFFARRFDRGLLQQSPQLHAELGGLLAHLRDFYYDTSVLEEPLVLRAAYDLVGADRLLLGSDYGRFGVTSSAAVDYVDSAAFLSADDRQSILGEAALRILAGQPISRQQEGD